MKSIDGGMTWTEPVELAPDPRGGTPMNPVLWKDERGVLRLWAAVGGRCLMSARADADLLDPKNWSPVGQKSELAELPDFPSGAPKIISEAQIVASPEHGVVILPKVQFTNTHSAGLRAKLTPAMTQHIRRPDEPGSTRCDNGSGKRYNARSAQGIAVVLRSPSLRMARHDGGLNMLAATVLSSAKSRLSALLPNG